MTDKTKGYRPSSMYIAPTIVLGLGGTGTSIIRHLKARLRQAVGDMPMPRLVEFLAVDTEPIQNLPLRYIEAGQALIGTSVFNLL